MNEQGQISVARTVVPHVTQDHAQQKGITVFDVKQRLERDQRRNQRETDRAGTQAAAHDTHVTIQKKAPTGARSLRASLTPF